MNMPIPLVTVKPPPQVLMRWGAVSAGLAVGLAVHLLFTILGAAAGFTVPAADGSSVGQLPVTAGTWNIVSTLAAAFCGGYVAARTSGLSRATDGVLYGLVAWGVTTLLFAALASSAIATIAGGLFGQLLGGAESAAHKPVPGASAHELSPPRMPGLDMVPRQHWQRYRMIRARSNAIADIERELKLPHERAARIVDDMIAADAVRLLQMQEQRDADLQAPAPSLPGERFLQRSQAAPVETPAVEEVPPPVTEPAPPPPLVEQRPGVEERLSVEERPGVEQLPPGVEQLPPGVEQLPRAPPQEQPARAAVNLAIWWLFAATAGSLLAAVLGGALGAHGTRRRAPRRTMIPPPVV